MSALSPLLKKSGRNSDMAEATTLTGEDPARSPVNHSTSIQNNSGRPQGPADPSTGRLLMRQTACTRRSLGGMIGGGTLGGSPHVRH